MSRNNTIVVDFKKCLLEMLHEAEEESHCSNVRRQQSMADLYFGRIDALREVITRANMLNEIK